MNGRTEDRFASLLVGRQAFAERPQSQPSAIALDASGNAWIANAGANTVTEFSHTGAAQSGTGFTNGMSQPSSVAVSTDGTVWVTNKGNGTVSRLNANGSAYASPYSGGGMSAPLSLTFDQSGTAWIANSGNASVTTIDPTGSTLTNYTAAGVSTPVAVVASAH